LGLNCHLLTAFVASLLNTLGGFALINFISSTLPIEFTSKFNKTSPLVPAKAASGGQRGAIFTSGIKLLVPDPKLLISPKKAP